MQLKAKFPVNLKRFKRCEILRGIKKSNAHPDWDHFRCYKAIISSTFTHYPKSIVICHFWWPLRAWKIITAAAGNEDININGILLSCESHDDSQLFDGFKNLIKYVTMTSTVTNDILILRVFIPSSKTRSHRRTDIPGTWLWPIWSD